MFSREAKEILEGTTRFTLSTSCFCGIFKTSQKSIMNMDLCIAGCKIHHECSNLLYVPIEQRLNLTANEIKQRGESVLIG